MSGIVLDASITMSWCFEDEADALSDRALQVVRDEGALVPVIWPAEILNALLSSERRRRITSDDSARFLDLLQSLPIETAETEAGHFSQSWLWLARAHRLTAYDAMYLRLAQQRSIPLASKDDALRKAAPAAAVELFALRPR